ncbi:hypothetical protein MES5069_40035 [Mesorhizobium escarrei]|uniref:Uncharacterized protein n=1 Tax=Mesorhizobium escarrei TaxID=666018 RepID=A0ABM9E3M1_9HYPH|nr:hypothetical protein MES5069_40035 [Mesorhizobium escarrei]
MEAQSFYSSDYLSRSHGIRTKGRASSLGAFSVAGPRRLCHPRWSKERSGAAQTLGSIP